MPTRIQRRRARGEDGAAMVEFALIAVLLVLLVTGIINFGLILSFKQDVTRAAAEGARTGAVALPPAAPPTAQTSDRRFMEATSGTEDAVDSFGQDCNVNDGMTCTVVLHDCDTDPVLDPVDLTDVSYWDNGDQDCVTVALDYDYDEHPLVAQPPVISAFLPDNIAAKSVARMNE